MAIKKTTKKRTTTTPSSIIGRNRDRIFSVVPGAKSISYEGGYKNGKMVYKYIPNTQANRNEINRIKGKPERHGKRLIWW